MRRHMSSQHGNMVQAAALPAWLTAYCRREWTKTSECDGLCTLGLALRHNGLHLGRLLEAISYYLIPRELGVCVRAEAASALPFPGADLRCHFQVVDPRSREIVVDEVLETPGQPGRHILCDQVAVAPDFACHAMLWHDPEDEMKTSSLDVFNFRTVPARSFCGGEFRWSDDDPEGSVCALAFASTEATLLACSARGEARLYKIDLVTEGMFLIWRRVDTWAELLRFWGSVGHVAVAPLDSDGLVKEIHGIHFEPQSMLTLFKISTSEPGFEDEHGEAGMIVAFSSSPTSDVFLVALTSNHVLKFRVNSTTKLPVTPNDCEIRIELVITPATIVALDWSDMGIILGDSYGLFYIFRDDSTHVLNSQGQMVWKCVPVTPTRRYDAVPPEASMCAVCEVFFWRSQCDR